MKNLNKKNGFNLKIKTKLLTVLLVTFLLSALIGTLFVGEASARIAYTQYTGTLSGADWALRIPDPWNGMLVVFCRGYSATGPGNPMTTLSSFSPTMLEAGFAVAASNYGVGGGTGIGQVTTYELTMYLIDNYDITGKIFLWGYSMGGGIALLLGEKYPDVYSGVLDVSGVKDVKAGYANIEKWAKMNEAELTAELTALGASVPPMGFSSLQAFMDFLTTGNDDIELETGGTPATHPTAYEDISPVYHADIQIPVITVHGTADPLVLYVTSLSYQNAVAKKGHSSLYRLYGVLGVEHIDANLFAEVPARFNELVEWSNELTGAHDWPMFGYDAQRTGYTTSDAPNTNLTLWTNRAGPTGAHPVVVDDKVYVPSWDGTLYCFDAGSGALIWNYTTGAGILCNPTFANGRIYFGSTDTNIYCLDALTGARIWSYAAGGVPGSGPAVAYGKVFMGADDGKLYCLRADYGQVEWKFTTGGSVLFAAVANGKVYFGSLDKKVYCVDAASGTLDWSYTTGDEVWGSPTIADGRVFVGSYDDNVYCLDASTGTKIWSFTTGNNVYSCPSIAYDKLYVGSLDDNVYCLDPETGALIWNYTTGGDVLASPTVACGKVYVGSYDRNFYCLDALTGAFIWNYQTNGIVVSSPVVANGVAYAASGSGNVYAFSAWEPIPEGLTIGVMLMLSTFAVVVSARYFRKRQKWENW